MCSVHNGIDAHTEERQNDISHIYQNAYKSQAHTSDSDKSEHPLRPPSLSGHDFILCDRPTCYSQITDDRTHNRRIQNDMNNVPTTCLSPRASLQSAILAFLERMAHSAFKSINSKSTKRICRLAVILRCFLFATLLSGVNAFCPNGCTCDDLVLSVRCTNASLSVIPYLLNPNVKYLKLLCNSIESLEQSLALYPKITTLDLGYNTLSSIEESDFEAQEKLTTLKLNNNRLTLVKKNSFKNLGELIELHLHNNDIHAIDPEAFLGLNKIAVLDLSNNRLKAVDEATLRPLISLERLYLNYNDFQHVPVRAINVLPSLRQLQLNGNKLSDVPPRSFQNLTNLLTINLDKNRIGLVAPDSFYGMESLSFLSLADNRLPYIPGRSFRTLRNLTGLELSGNMFQHVDKHSIPALPQLTLLRIGRSPRLNRVTSRAFVGVPSLEVLDLSQNAQLTTIDDQALSVLPSLKELDLTACSLTYIDPTQISRSKSTKLHVAGNPFHCNCSLLWLAKLPRNGTLSMDGPTCASPPKFHGMALHDIDFREAGCSFTFGWPAIIICVGIVLLGFLVIGIFLATRTKCSKPPPPTKTLPKGDIPRSIHLPPQFPPPPPFTNQNLYGPKIPLPAPPTFSPSVRPLLPSPAPSPTHQALLPADWMFSSPYDDETHWYSTLGKDGREYLTADIAPPHCRPPIPPPPNDRLQRNPSICSRPPSAKNGIYQERKINNGEGPPLDSRGLPITYI